MKFSALSRTGFAVALSAVLASMVAPAQAETVDSIFAKVSPSVRDRMFFRLNYVHANVKTTSGAAYDVTGALVSAGSSQTTSDVRQYLAGGSYQPQYGITKGQYRTIGNTLYAALQQDVAAGYLNEAAGLGTPDNIKAKAQESVGTPALSVGYFLSDDFSWFVEALVLAAPLKVTVQGDGVNGQGLPNGLNGKDIINLKLLPPTGIFGRYFGNRDAAFRPFVGLGASYAMFFDVRATDALNSYQGGSSSGDTSINIKNVMGFGPFVGFKAKINEDWHIGLNVGKLAYKTEATIVTRNTRITTPAGQSAQGTVAGDYGPNVSGTAITGVELSGLYSPIDSNGNPISVTTALMCDLAAAKGISNTCNYGTYERKQTTRMDNTMIMLSVGRSF